MFPLFSLFLYKLLLDFQTLERNFQKKIFSSEEKSETKLNFNIK